MLRRFDFAALLLAVLVLAGFVPAKQRKSIHVLILSGRNNHDWRTSTPHLRNMLADTGRFDVRVDEEPFGLTAESLKPYDAVVLNYNGVRWGGTVEKALQDFVRSGKGLVALHGASYPFGGREVLGDNHARTGIVEPSWKGYADMLGTSWSMSAPKTRHAPRHIFRVEFEEPHPITEGVGSGFTTSDGLYHNLRMRPGVQVIASAHDDAQNKGTAKAEPVLWSLSYGSGRVFHSTLGHDLAGMMEPGFIATFVRGVEWAASGKASIGMKLEPDTPKGLPRVLVVTGGHGHEPSFYAMLDEFKDVLINVNPHPAAYSHDLRRDYDVIVLYDLVQKVEERQRKNLRSFVENGDKGIVAIHHSIANFNDWEWWCQNVIGGSYRMKESGNQPASTYKHDEELRITPVAEHPILRGIGPMHMWDETYKLMWISPSVKVLLKTDNRTSDGPVAWVSPYENARVAIFNSVTAEPRTSIPATANWSTTRFFGPRGNSKPIALMRNRRMRAVVSFCSFFVVLLASHNGSMVEVEANDDNCSSSAFISFGCGDCS